MTDDPSPIDQAAKRLGRTVRRLAVREQDDRGLPAIDYVDGRTYFVDAQSVRYRIHDTTFAQHRHTRVPLGSAAAHYRIFVKADGERRAYQFRKGELHDVTVAHCERQLREAGYLPRPSKDDPTKREPW